jgi:hypothetical protein
MVRLEDDRGFVFVYYKHRAKDEIIHAVEDPDRKDVFDLKDNECILISREGALNYYSNYLRGETDCNATIIIDEYNNAFLLSDKKSNRFVFEKVKLDLYENNQIGSIFQDLKKVFGIKIDRIGLIKAIDCISGKYVNFTYFNEPNEKDEIINTIKLESALSNPPTMVVLSECGSFIAKVPKFNFSKSFILKKELTLQVLEAINGGGLVKLEVHTSNNERHTLKITSKTKNGQDFLGVLTQL